jgi:tetratricopeptide (TPR) repeat protein
MAHRAAEEQVTEQGNAMGLNRPVDAARQLNRGDAEARKRSLLCLRVSASPQFLFALLLLGVCASSANAAALDEMSLERWAKLREVERYQLKIAEEHFRKQEWKTALSEYEKFLTLYEESEGAPYSLLKWSLCQLHLRNQHTAISEGFQSVIDYWPESPEAISASYFIGQTLKNIGEPQRAKKAYAEVLKKHSKHLVAVYAMHDLVEISEIEMDLDTRVMLWKKLAFECERTKESQNFCTRAAQQLASYYFHEAAFPDGLAALETTYKGNDLPPQVYNYAQSAANNLKNSEETKPKAEKLADQAIAWLKAQQPADLTTEEAKTQARQRWYEVIGLCATLGRDAEVIKLYGEVETKFGKSDDTLGRFASWYRNKPAVDDAGRAQNFEKARLIYNRFENQVEGRALIADSFHQEQKFDQAVTAYQQTLALDPQNPVRWKPQIAVNYRHAGKPDPAIAVYRELIVDDGTSPGRWQMEIARTLRDSGRYDDAIKQYNACDDFPQNYVEMADCYERLKKWQEAIRTYAQIVSAQEGQSRAPWATLRIGYAYEKAGNKEAAIKAFQQVCKNYPKDGHASQAHAHLQTDYGISVTFGGGKDEE